MLFFNNTKLCTQILCFMFVILLPCCGMFLGAMYINFNLFEGIVLDSSLKILNRQFSKQIKTFSFFSHQMIEKYQFREKQRLESVNRIYQFTWNIDLNLINIEQCLNKNISKYSGKCSMCFGVMNQKANLSQTNFNKYLKIANLFSVTFFMGDNNFDIIVAGSSEEKFIAVWPQQGVISFDPQSRPWYQLEYNQPNTSQAYSTHFTQPYIHSAFKSITVSHTQTLYDNDFSRIGVVTIQLNFSSTFPSFLQNNTRITGYILDENFYILEDDGQFVQVSTFFNSNVTGFNDSNTIFLQNYLNKGEILSTCKEFDKSILCLKDVNNQEFIVEAQVLRDYNQIFILVFNPSTDLAVLQMRKDALNQKLDTLTQTALIRTLPGYFSLLLLSVFIIYQISNKISQITQQAEAIVFKNNANNLKIIQLQIFDIEKIGSLNCLEKLELAFASLNFKLINNSKRNPQCQKMTEIFHFCQKNQSIQLDLKGSINLLHDKEFCPPKRFIIKFISEPKLRNLQKQSKPL